MASVRRVSFPESAEELVTGYLEPANPWKHVSMIKTIPEIAELYIVSCQKHKTEPLTRILDHLKLVDLQSHLRQPLLSLKSINLEHSDCEALEEIFKRIQYIALDFSNCDLNETAASALFEIIEYYEATNELDISFNAKGMTHRGWASCNYMISHSEELLTLNAEGNPISKLSAENLGSALCSSNLHTLKLEHCGLRGLPLYNLCFKLRNNRVLKELWLGHNDLDCNDADTIAELVKANHYLELIDVSNNDIRDEGLRHIVIALIIQSKELERRKILQHSFAPEKYESNDTTSFVAVPSSNLITVSNTENANEWINNKENIKNFKDKFLDGGEENEIEKGRRSTIQTAQKDYEIVIDNGDKSIKEVTQLNNEGNDNQCTGQSMLDKLLSINNGKNSIKEEAPILSANATIADYSDDDARSVHFSDEYFNNNVNATNLTKECKEEKQNEILSKIDLLSVSTSAPPACSSPTIAIDTLTVHNLRDVDVISTLPESTNEIGGGSFVNNNHSVSFSENQIVETFTKKTSSCPHTEDKSEIFEMNKEIKKMTSPFDSAKIDSNKLNSCIKVLDINKNTKLNEDCDDSHSTDSAFESASEGDISRHLPDELTRLSDSLDARSFENISKEFTNETIAPTPLYSYNNSEYSIVTTTNSMSSSTSTTQSCFETVPHTTNCTVDSIAIGNNCCHHDSSKTTSYSRLGIVVCLAHLEYSSTPTITKTTNYCNVDPENNNSKDITTQYKQDMKCRSNNGFTATGPATCMPYSANTNNACNTALRRVEPSCTMLTQSSRTYSQSSDSLCSDNSLDGSTSSVDLTYAASSQLNEKLTKNDTLTRQQRQVNVTTESIQRIPQGLKVLSIWNNNLTKDSALSISDLLSETVCLELLNIGKNCLSNDFLINIKASLIKNATLSTLGLQSAHLSSKGIETLSSILNFGGNNSLKRIDIRDNIIEVESLQTIAEVLKCNTMVTQIDIDDEPKRLSVGSEAQLEYTRLLENVRSICSRNEKAQVFIQTEKSMANTISKKRGGYYLGSRKISLTCHGRPINDTLSKNVDAIQHHPPPTKLEVKRKTGTRLRSPVPSPPTISPSSSPNRTSRFQVFRVSEMSPLTSLTSASSSNVITQTDITKNKLTNTLSLSHSLPSMTMVSSTQSIKRLGEVPRSRFHVKRIYEDSIISLNHRPIASVTTQSTESTPISNTLNNRPDHWTKYQTSSNDIPTQKSVKQLTYNIPTSLPIDITTTSWSMPKIETDVVDKSIKQNVPASIPSSKQKISTSTSSCKAGHGYNKFEKLCKTTAEPAPVSTGTIAKKPHLRYSSTTSTSLLSPSTSLSSLSSNEDYDISSCTPIETERDPKVPTVGQCPIAIFSENDITLTNNTLTTFNLLSPKEVTTNVPKFGAYSLTNSSTILKSNSNIDSTKTEHRIRKTSFIPNTKIVENLLTLFHHPEAIFQHKSQASASTITCESSITTRFLNETTNQSAQKNDLIEESMEKCFQSDRISISKLKTPPSLASLCDNNLNNTAIAAMATSNYKDNTRITSDDDNRGHTKQLLLETSSKELKDLNSNSLYYPYGTNSTSNVKDNENSKEINEDSWKQSDTIFVAGCDTELSTTPTDLNKERDAQKQEKNETLTETSFSARILESSGKQTHNVANVDNELEDCKCFNIESQ